MLISIGDRQALKLLEDCIIDLQLILPKLLGVVDGLKVECSKWRIYEHLPLETARNYDQIISWFDLHSKELELLMRSAEVLREKAQDTTKLAYFKSRREMRL